MPYRSSVYPEPPCKHNTKTVVATGIGIFFLTFVVGFFMGFSSGRDEHKDLVTRNQRLTQTLNARPAFPPPPPPPCVDQMSISYQGAVHCHVDATIEAHRMDHGGVMVICHCRRP